MNGSGIVATRESPTSESSERVVAHHQVSYGSGIIERRQHDQRNDVFYLYAFVIYARVGHQYQASLACLVM